MYAAKPAPDHQPQDIKKLPPLILHPFSDSSGPGKLIESSRANMMLQGLLPSGDFNHDQLERTLVQGRYHEIRMLFYVGRDINRWIEQCMDFVSRQPELKDAGIKAQSFADRLVTDPPAIVEAKLRRWGVGDFRSIFSRAIGLNVLFADVPAREILGEEFIRGYARYADEIFNSRQGQVTFADLRQFPLEFEVFASGEYTRMLERQWA